MDNFQPVFNFDGNLTSEDEINQMMEEAEQRSGGGSIFRPGKHSLVVSSVELKGVAKADPAWMKVLIRFNGMEKESGKKITSWVLVPTTGRLTYSKNDGENSIYPFKNLTETMAALGVTLTRDNVGSLVPELFAPANLGALVGKTCVSEIGYKGTYAQGVKSDDGTKQCQLVKGDKVLKDDTGTVILFKGDDAFDQAEKHAIKIGENFANFPEIISLSAVESLDDTGSGNNW